MQSMGLWDEFLVMFMADSCFDIVDYFATGLCIYLRCALAVPLAARDVPMRGLKWSRTTRRSGHLCQAGTHSPSLASGRARRRHRLPLQQLDRRRNERHGHCDAHSHTLKTLSRVCPTVMLLNGCRRIATIHRHKHLFG